MARVRANRAERRRRQGRPSSALRNIPPEYSTAIAPGLPGGAPYVPIEELYAEAERHFDAVAEMHPGMVQRARDVARLGISGRAPRLRHVRESAPGGLGRGVVLGEFTPAPGVADLVLPEKKTAGGLILPGVPE